MLFELTSIHVVVEKHGGRLPYPVNVARNLAQQSIESNFFLLMDVDFLPSRGAHRWLVDQLEKTKNQDHFWSRLRNSTLFVLPAFERKPLEENGMTTADLVPLDKVGLERGVNDGTVTTFHPYFSLGHMQTRWTGLDCLWAQLVL